MGHPLKRQQNNLTNPADELQPMNSGMSPTQASKKDNEMTQVSISSDIVDKFRTASSAVSNQFVGRESSVQVIMAAMIARQHVFMLGPPGTGKSALGRSISSAMNAPFWQYLFGRTTTPDEVFGPLDLRALKDGRYERITTSRMPECAVAFMDEIGNANSSVQNIMLTAINERKFDAGKGLKDIPLRTVLAASNQLPDPQESGAFMDRFLVKLFIDDSAISRDDWESVISSEKQALPVAASVNLDDWDTASSEADAIECNGAKNALWKIRADLEAQEITHTVRRWKAVLSLCRAKAWMEGRAATVSADALVAEHCLWRFPKEREVVSNIVCDHCSGCLGDARRLAEGARKFLAELPPEETDVEALSRVVREVGLVVSQIHELKDPECDLIATELQKEAHGPKKRALKHLGMTIE